MDLTSFIFEASRRGQQSIQIHFELTSDGSVEYQGWLVDDITVMINDSFVTLAGVPQEFSDPADIDISIAAPQGTTYTSAFAQTPDATGIDCSDDSIYPNPVPSVPFATPLRLAQDTSARKWLCVRANVPGFKGSITAWAGWRLKSPEIRVVATGQPTGESNTRSFNLTVNAGDRGNPTSYSTALARLQSATDACAATDLSWSSWIPTGQSTIIDVFTFLQGNDSDVVLCVRGRDDVGNVQESPLALTWRADFHGPDVTIEPTVAPVNNLTNHSIRISLTTDRAQSNICGFTVLRDTTTCPRDWTAYGSCAFAPGTVDIVANADGRWTVCAAARDRAGNMSASPAALSWVRDTVPPVPELSGSLISRPMITSKSPTGIVTVGGTGVVTWRYATGKTIADCTSWSPDISASTPVTLGIIPGGEGQRLLCVIGRDAAGNESTPPTTSTWTQDTQAAALTFAGLPPAISSASTLRVSVSAAEAGTYRYLVTAGTTCDVTNLMRAPRHEMTDSITANLPVSDGNYTICASFTDAAGNDQSTPTTFTWLKDTVPPVALFTRNPPSRTSNPASEFAIDGADVTAYQWAFLDGAAACGNPAWSSFAPVADSVSVNAGQPGAKLMCVRGRDAAGNVQATPTAYRWTVVPPAPPVLQVISGAPFSPTGKNSWSLVTGGDRVTAWQYALLNSQTSNCAAAAYGAFNPARAGSGPNPLRFNDTNPDGYRTLCLRGKDAFDLVQTTPTILRWLKITGGPQVEPFTTWGTITRATPNGPSNTTENLVLTRANTANVSESINLRMCPVAATTGRLGTCKSTSVSLAAGATSKSTSIANVGTGTWVVVALPPQGRGRVEPLLVRK
ncbi:hypothetical protein EBZ80_23025 [bacterium]|nr:hypothetical protein [bacterium]